MILNPAIPWILQGKSKAHVLTEEKRKAMWRVAHVHSSDEDGGCSWRFPDSLRTEAAVGAGILAGIGAAFFAQVHTTLGVKICDEIRWDIMQWWL